jgi:hypothetical protein
MGAVPAGLGVLLSPFPGTAVPGYHIPPLRGWSGSYRSSSVLGLVWRLHYDFGLALRQQ